ncbi:MAG: hypothetical protein EBV42_01430, partial [Actinobacteria bacterium]|nr:hypothetical protein [Actinomycetota bacterium]
MIVHLVDGTYELYRQFYGQLGRHTDEHENAGVMGVLSSTLQLLQDGAAHVGVATDHVIESFRNDLWPGYKTSEGMEPDILRQIPVLEDALRAMGVTVWAMEEFEADDALASAVRVACEDRRVHQVQLLTPDKDLGQCVSGRRVVQVDRRNDVLIDETSKADGWDCVPVFPLDPGVGGEHYGEMLKKLPGVQGKNPELLRQNGSKITRAQPLKAMMNRGKVYILQPTESEIVEGAEEWQEPLLKCLANF